MSEAGYLVMERVNVREWQLEQEEFQAGREPGQRMERLVEQQGKEPRQQLDGDDGQVEEECNERQQEDLERDEKRKKERRGETDKEDSVADGRGRSQGYRLGWGQEGSRDCRVLLEDIEHSEPKADFRTRKRCISKAKPAGVHRLAAGRKGDGKAGEHSQADSRAEEVERRRRWGRDADEVDDGAHEARDKDERAEAEVRNTPALCQTP